MQTIPSPSRPDRARGRRPLGALVGAALIAGLPTVAAAPAYAATAPTASATSTVAVVSADQLGDRTLSFGMRGSDVSALQKMLGIKQTKRFNLGTKRAVKRTERAAGLRVNGIVTKKNIEPMRKELRRQRQAQLANGSPDAMKRWAKGYIARKYNWGGSQHNCLVPIWERESNWQYWVSNPNGRYHGIPQTSSAVWGPMGYTTSQYMNNPGIQVKVGAKYIKGRYGNPCKALSFWNANHWY